MTLDGQSAFLGQRRYRFALPPADFDNGNAVFRDQWMKRGQDAKAATDPTPNLGLGLFIAEKIVAAHGGDLSVTSGRESGTVFIARLPR